MDDECESCGFPTSNLHECESSIPRRKLKLCTICYSTSAGNAALYPTQDPNSDVLTTIAYISNMILDEIRNLKKE